MEIKRKTFVISYPENKMENQKKKKSYEKKENENHKHPCW